MPEVNSSDWDEFLRRQKNPHLLQTGRWGQLKSAFGWEVTHVVLGDCGAQILFRRSAFGFSLAYIPRGPVGGDWAPLLPEIDRICRAKRAVLLKVEPDVWLDDGDNNNPAPPGFIPSPDPIQPPRTITIPIGGSEEEILGRMKQKTRYNISLAARSGIEVAPSSDVTVFHKMVVETGDRSEFGIHSLAYYKAAYDLFHPLGMCELFLARYGSEAIAGLMVFALGERAWYFYGASTEKERSRMPAYLLQWEAIRWARRSGCVDYDLWGVPDEDLGKLEANFTARHDGLWGVYRFKRGFGGELRRSAGPWDRIYQPALYRVYRWSAQRRSD